MGKRNMENTVFLQLSFGITGFFVKCICGAAKCFCCARFRWFSNVAKILFPPSFENLDFKIACSRKSRLCHMGKRKMANTVVLQLSFGINGFFVKMYMWCCKIFFLRKVSMVFKFREDSFPSVNEIFGF